jgi:hypothetical protein
MNCYTPNNHFLLHLLIQIFTYSFLFFCFVFFTSFKRMSNFTLGTDPYYAVPQFL